MKNHSSPSWASPSRLIKQVPTGSIILITAWRSPNNKEDSLVTMHRKWIGNAELVSFSWDAPFSKSTRGYGQFQFYTKTFFFRIYRQTLDRNPLSAIGDEKGTTVPEFSWMEMPSDKGHASHPFNCWPHKAKNSWNGGINMLTSDKISPFTSVIQFSVPVNLPTLWTRMKLDSVLSSWLFIAGY